MTAPAGYDLTGIARALVTTAAATGMFSVVSAVMVVIAAPGKYFITLRGGAFRRVDQVG